MKNQTGYKQMLRDRCPKVVDYALKYFKSKEAWLNHVYDNRIWIYSSNKERLKETRSLLGLDKKPRNFVFEDTILWDNFSNDEKNHWKKICSCVSWFREQYKYVEDDYADSKRMGKDLQEFKYDVMIKYLCRADAIKEYRFLDELCPTKEDDADTRKQKNIRINYFVDFLIECMENHIIR